MSKAGKRRFCPAVTREISPAECGDNRGSRYACPAECAFNPFAPANYDHLLEMEEAVDREALTWLARNAQDRTALQREIQRQSGDKSPRALHAALIWQVYFTKDAQGLTCAQRWEKAGFPGLKNDQRTLSRAKMGIKIALLEIRRVLDHERTEVVDLLSARPEPFIILDRGLASSAIRFATGFTFTYALPHYHRLFGTAILLPEFELFDPREVVEEIVRHLGGPMDEEGMRRWLTEHFQRVDAALEAVTVERRRLAFLNMDLSVGKAVYELQAPFAQCCERLDDAPNVGEDELGVDEQREGFAGARAWFCFGDEPVGAPEGAESVLGRVLLAQAHWRLEAFGSARLATLRSGFERQMGPLVKFTGERRDDLGKTMAGKEPKVDLTLVPPRLLENPPIIEFSLSRMPISADMTTPEELRAESMADLNRGFLDDKIPALGGRTPREAARDSALRPKLIQLMKSRVRSVDERNRDTGSNEDVNWMLRELGLDEINFEPPPSGRVPRILRAGTDENEDDADSEANEAWLAEEPMPMNPKLPPAPRLPSRPFTLDEVHQRMKSALASLASGADALEQMESAGCTLIDDIDFLMGDEVDDNSFSLLIPLLANIWFTFVPPGTRGPNLPRAQLDQAIQSETFGLMDAMKADTPAALDRYIDSGPQPNLSGVSFGLLVTAAQEMPKKQRPLQENQILFVAVLRAVIAELDRVHRELA